MVEIVIASHGVFCEGSKSSAEIVGGTTAQCIVVALQPGEDPDIYGEYLCRAVDRMDNGYGMLTLIDFRGGTSFNRSIMLTRKRHIMFTVGANFPTLLSVALGKHEDSTLEELAALTEEKARESTGTIYFNRQWKRSCIMESLLLVRIGDRLIYGWVMTAWMKTLPVRQITVIGDKVTKDNFMLFVLQNAAPNGIKMIMLMEEGALHKLQGGLDIPSFVLVKSLLSLRKPVDGGIEIKVVNIGGMGMKAGRTTVCKNVSATDEECRCTRDFLDRDIDIAIQAIPGKKCFELNNILAR